jgi:hypothetical protein
LGVGVVVTGIITIITMTGIAITKVMATGREWVTGGQA